jgi:hypothetical protein
MRPLPTPEPECPNCGAKADTEDVYETDTVYHVECGECLEHFAMTVEYEPRYQAYRAPCLNGGAHLWDVTSFQPSGRKYRCSACDAEKDAPLCD